MRSAPTDAEQRLWQILRAKRLSAYKFKRQVPIDSFIVDFVCLRQRLIVEADGGQHRACHDGRRDAYLRAQGFRIRRFWNNDILTNAEGVTQRIFEALESSLPNPSGRQSCPPDKTKDRPDPARGEGLQELHNG